MAVADGLPLLGSRSCPICDEEAPDETWQCPLETCGQEYCIPCMTQWWRSNQAASRCPGEGCTHRFAEDDLRRFGASVEELEALRQGGVDAALSAAGSTLFRCPSEHCTNRIVVAGPGRHCFTCACGVPPTCTGCSQLYHYRSECSDVQSARRAWLRWVTTGRQAYIKAERRLRRAPPVQLQSARESVERQRAMLEDEKWKMKYCRLCPQCQRVLQKVFGCDAMVVRRRTITGETDSPAAGGASAGPTRSPTRPPQQSSQRRKLARNRRHHNPA